MPWPEKLTPAEGVLAIDNNFTIALEGYTEPRLERAALRTITRLQRQTGMLAIAPRLGKDPGAATLVIWTKGASAPVQKYNEDESYTLTVTPQKARLEAANPLGALRGFETFLELVTSGAQGFAAPCVTIEDHPRFPWRGLSLDVSRHWIPPGLVRRTIDGMAAVKMNVLHWHLSDDQGFRVESKVFPKLQEAGSEGNYYTQAQVKEIIEYARDRGIRIVPEFDIPGHTSAILAAFPELGSGPGPYTIQRGWGVFDPTLDPSKEEVYSFLDRFIGEMAGLFPDAYFHIGGDEVNGKEWKASARIQAFMKEHNLKDLAAFHQYFNQRVQKIVDKYGKIMEGWDEILAPDLPRNIVIHSWRGPKSLAQAAQLGYSGILSAGWYLDLMQPTSQHYLVDPISGDAAKLKPEEQARILGGEAAMWEEYATAENLDLKLWPRMAAIAERLWSPASVKDVDDLYRRLAVIGNHLVTLGLTHQTAPVRMAERLAPDAPVAPLLTLISAVEPVKGYARNRGGRYTSLTPLNRTVDFTPPESDASRELLNAVERSDWPAARAILTRWKGNDAVLQPILASHSLLQELQPISTNLEKTAALGLEAIDMIEAKRAPAAGWADAANSFLTEAIRPQAELLLMPVRGVQALVKRAAQ
jgi:hexosaminidase